MITNERWTDAQKAENQYWLGIDAAELLRICAEKPHFLTLCGDRLRGCFDGRAVLDIGCGPLGISVASHQPWRATTRLTKVDPLPRLDLASLPAADEPWAAGFVGWAGELAAHGEYVQAPAEQLEWADRFDTVVTYNVLDHVQDPERILRNAHRALKPGGVMIVGVDCRSLLARLKFDLIVRTIYKHLTVVKAHPFSFSPDDIVRLLEKAGFVEVEARGVPNAAKRLVGGAYRPMFLGRKP